MKLNVIFESSRNVLAKMEAKTGSSNVPMFMGRQIEDYCIIIPLL